MQREYDPKDLKHYFNVMRLSATHMQRNILTVLLPIVDLFTGVIAKLDPFDKLYAYPAYTILGLLNLFGIWVALAPYKRQVEGQLFLGIYGILAPLCFLISAQKIIYDIVMIHNFWFFFFSFVMLIAWIVFLMRWNIHNLSTGYYRIGKKAKHKPKRNPIDKAIGVVAGLGMAGAFVAIQLAGYSAVMGSLAIVYLILACAFSMMLPGIYKYYLIRKHRELYEWEKPYAEATNRRKRRKAL